VTVTLDDKRLRELIATARPKASRVVKKYTFKVEAAAKMLAAVDTGAMRNSIASEMVDDLTGQVSVGQEYAPYVEFGTSRMRAQPFLVPALEGNRAGFQSEIAELFK
jgi:HK97 gp10 family phage protein